MLFTALCLTSAVTTLIVVLAVLVVFLAVFFALVPVGTWFRALVSGARISMGRLIGMRLRRINIRMIVEAYINAVKAGLEIDVVELETHYMAGGDVFESRQRIDIGAQRKHRLVPAYRKSHRPCGARRPERGESQRQPQSHRNPRDFRNRQKRYRTSRKGACYRPRKHRASCRRRRRRNHNRPCRRRYRHDNRQFQHSRRSS